MTVIPFDAHLTDQHLTRRHLTDEHRGSSASRADSARVTGSFSSPSGSVGRFTGSYRLERLVTQFGHLAAAGVFAGQLNDADDTLIGIGSRRHTAAIVAVARPECSVAEFGPVEVNLTGFPVSVCAFEVTLSDVLQLELRMLEA